MFFVQKRNEGRFSNVDFVLVCFVIKHGITNCTDRNVRDLTQVVDFTSLIQVYKNQTSCNLIIAHFLQVVETACIKLVDKNS